MSCSKSVRANAARVMKPMLPVWLPLPPSPFPFTHPSSPSTFTFPFSLALYRDGFTDGVAGESALGNKLCGTIGGILNNTGGTGGILDTGTAAGGGNGNPSAGANGTETGNGGGTGGTSPPISFTGQATTLVVQSGFWIVLGVVGGCLSMGF